MAADPPDPKALQKKISSWAEAVLLELERHRRAKLSPRKLQRDRREALRTLAISEVRAAHTTLPAQVPPQWPLHEMIRRDKRTALQIAEAYNVSVATVVALKEGTTDLRDAYLEKRRLMCRRS